MMNMSEVGGCDCVPVGTCTCVKGPCCPVCGYCFNCGGQRKRSMDTYSCKKCGDPITLKPGRGRPKIYCDRCRGNSNA
jgi:hypothetical protein